MDATMLISRQGIPATRTREAILRVFLATSRPQDAQEVLAALAAAGEDVNRATVFRTLNTFAEKGVLNRLEFNEGKTRYELADTHHHHHMVCTSCKSVACVSECDIDALQMRVQKATGFQVQSHRLEFFGVCRQCQ